MNEYKTEEKELKGISYRATAVFDHFNSRMRIDDYRGNMEELLSGAEKAALEKGFTKLIVKGKSSAIHELLNKQYQLEAVIKGYFHGDHAYFFTRYFSEDRRTTTAWTEQDRMMNAIYEKEKSDCPDTSDFVFRKAEEKDAEGLASLYKTVFEVYPTPLHSSDYIVKTMKEGTIYLLAEKNMKIVSAASAELNRLYHNAELTDCATLPETRKHRLMRTLLLKLEDVLMKEGIYCAYSIARAASFGMNAVLFQLDYEYTGRLTNNCIISTDYENMNVWCKDLSAEK
ncbi:putative beta-lysine N-acetyltransferase [Metabacillus indicus]|uniref:putative beta-lysine N-acetyltransferase n=1 Tax=Metabacillus indicus TaxID=246786 RepID=UPI003CEB8771